MLENVSCFWTFTEGAAISNTEFWLLEPEFYVLRFVLCVVILLNNMNLDFNTIVRLQNRKPSRRINQNQFSMGEDLTGHLPSG